MNDNFPAIADVITLVANDQYAEASPIIHDLLGARVLDAMQSHKQTIAQSLFAPSADALAEETEQLVELSKDTLKSYVKKSAKEVGTNSGLGAFMASKGYNAKQSNPHKSDEWYKRGQEYDRKAAQRMHGVRQATDKLEESERLDEMQTRKDFQQVADVIKAHPDAKKRQELAAHHAGIFKTSNPRFDSKRFYAAANATLAEEAEQLEEKKKDFEKSGKKNAYLTKGGKFSYKKFSKDRSSRPEKFVTGA